MIARRTLIRALPFLGVTAALPALATPIDARTPQEQFDLHAAALAGLIAQNVGPCDGWRVTMSSHPRDYDGYRIQGIRHWVVGEMVGSRLLPLDRFRDFDPRTGLSTDWRDDPHSHQNGGI